MAAADDPGTADRGTALRAETYLRLLAEAELRAALASPRHEPPRRRARAGAAVRAQATEALERLESVAAAFAATGAVDVQLADAVTDGLALALAARHRIDIRQLGWRGDPMWHSQRRVPAPAGPFRAAGVATTVRVQTLGKVADLHLLTLVLAPDKCVLTAAGQPSVPHPSRPAGGAHPTIPFADLAAAASDDQGRRYQLDQDGASWSDEDWNGTFALQPLPPPGIGWLDLVMAAGQPPIRVQLPAEPAAEPTPAAGAGPGTRSADSGEWLVDQASDRCAASLARWDGPEAGTFAELWPVVCGLQAAGVLADGSPAVARLVSVARAAGADIPAELSQLPAAELPERWLQAVGRRGERWDGVPGFVPAAAVLPELDGTRCVLAGLTSGRESATLDVLAWGWPLPRHHRRFGGIEDQLAVWARDDAGRWYSSTAAGGGFSDSHADLRFDLRPAPHPEASELEIILAGRAGQVSATVPLDWRPLP